MIKFTGRNEGIVGIKKITMIRANTQKEMRFALHTIGAKHKRNADNAILGRTEKKRGRVYRVRTGAGKRTRRHRASAPGQSHANLSGRLRRSIGWKVRGSKQLEFGYGLGKEEAPDYAAFVEGGTSRMKARSSLLNAMRSERRNTLRAALVIG